PSGRISNTPSAKMCPSFSLCACRILKIRSCLRRPLAPGSSKDRAILVSSVMFFSLSSAMVIIYLRGFFVREGLSFLVGDGIALPPCGHTAELLKQLAAVLRQSSRVRSGCHDAPHRRFCQTPGSWFPECGYSAYETCALPWKRAGKACTDSAKYVERQTRDQIAFPSFSFNMNNLGHDPIVCPAGRRSLGEPSCNSGRVQGFARITQIDAPPNPKVAQFFKEVPHRGRRFVRTIGILHHVQRTAKYNKPLGKVKKNLRGRWITLPVPAKVAAARAVSTLSLRARPVVGPLLEKREKWRTPLFMSISARPSGRPGGICSARPCSRAK